MLGVVAGRVPFLPAACVFCAGLGLQLGVTPVSGARLPVSVRAFALGVPAAVAIAGLGGTLPLVEEWLAASGHLDVILLYVSAASTATAVGSWLLNYGLLYDDNAGTLSATQTRI